MKRKLFEMLLIACIAIFFVPGCSKNDGDSSTTDGSSEGSLADHEGANEVVTVSNVDAVTKEINATAWDVFGRAIRTPSFKAATNLTTNLNGDVAGRSSGKASVIGTAVTKMTGILTTGVDYNIVSVFYDFSDDGEMYFGGSLTYKGSVKYNSKSQFESNTITYKGGLKFNGAYSGTEDITTTVKVDSAGNYSFEGTATVTSGGETFTQSFKY